MLVHLGEGLHYEGLVDTQVLQQRGQGQGLLVLKDLHDTGRGTPNGKKTPLFHKFVIKTNNIVHFWPLKCVNLSSTS